MVAVTANPALVAVKADPEKLEVYAMPALVAVKADPEKLDVYAIPALVAVTAEPAVVAPPAIPSNSAANMPLVPLTSSPTLIVALVNNANLLAD